MHDIYDPQFEPDRLNELAEQCLSGTDINGDVVFRCCSEVNQLDIATWCFPENDQERIRESNFHFLLMSLLDDLIIYRTRCGLENSRDGCVSVRGSEASIRWLKDGEGELLAKQLSEAEEGH
ncbi:hypothetical protein [Marinobacter salarius]|uniref:hypothetical protein n=1 Tax=Marinobacter salarius TaxID=1420917 RepID=UPI000F85B1B1|nr:hypothetical protein [Marinobacter salarius]AZR42998.1 hypothetical protein MTMN5_03565 [Marinobacter salarius]